MNSEAKSVLECGCGAVRYYALDDPLFGICCHCSICQRFNDAAYADVFVFRAAQIERPAADAVDFSTCRPPPNVQRGKCKLCSQPVIEVFESLLLPDLVMIPGRMFEAPDRLPPVRAHLFYDKRIGDVADGLPKHAGYWRSQLAFGTILLTSMRGRKDRDEIERA